MRCWAWLLVVCLSVGIGAAQEGAPPQGGLGRDAGETETMLRMLETEYGKQRADEVFKMVLDKVNQGGDQISIDEVKKMVEGKLQEVKTTVEHPANRAGHSEEDTQMSQSVSGLTARLIQTMKDDHSREHVSKMTSQVRQMINSIDDIEKRLKADIAKAEALVERVGRLTIKLKDKQDMVTRRSKTVTIKFTKEAGRARLRSMLYVAFVLELLALTLFAAFKKYSRRRKFDKLG